MCGLSGAGGGLPPQKHEAYILGTFPIVRRHDEKAYGEQRTERLILAAYDAMAEAARSGGTYATPLSPAPGDASVRHG